jgi:membrane-associated phospholipid phosphatase
MELLQKLVKVYGKIKSIHFKKMTTFGVFRNHLIGGLLLSLGFMFLFAKLAKELLDDELKIFDQMVGGFINHMHSPLTTQIMKGITMLGSPTIMIFLALVTWFYLRKTKNHYWDSNMVIIALVGSWIVNEILKWFFHRSRPEIVHLVKAAGYSFPSGHAMVSFVFYGMLAYLTWINIGTRKLRYLVTITLLLLVLAIGISRIYLGVHYPSDVLAGFSAGGFWLVGCILGLQSIRYYKSNV